MKAEVLPDYNSSCTNSSNIENGQINQPELDQQLKNIISLIQVGLIDPKENPIIIGSPKDDEDDKPSKLSFCDKLKIIGILVFLVIVTVVVTLCIIYMFACEDFNENADFSSNLALIKVVQKDGNNYCMGTLYSQENIFTSIECFNYLKNLSSMSSTEIKSYFNNQKYMDKISNMKVYLNLKDNKITSKNTYSVIKISLFENKDLNLGKKNRGIIAIEIDLNYTINAPTFKCLLNSTNIKKNSTNALVITGEIINNQSIKINKVYRDLKQYKKDDKFVSESVERNCTEITGSPYFLKENSNIYKFAGVQNACEYY